jgi:hypothetical protein
VLSRLLRGDCPLRGLCRPFPTAVLSLPAIPALPHPRAISRRQHHTAPQGPSHQHSHHGYRTGRGVHAQGTSGVSRIESWSECVSIGRPIIMECLLRLYHYPLHVIRLNGDRRPQPFDPCNVMTGVLSGGEASPFPLAEPCQPPYPHRPSLLCGVRYTPSEYRDLWYLRQRLFPFHSSCPALNIAECTWPCTRAWVWSGLRICACSVAVRPSTSYE